MMDLQLVKNSMRKLNIDTFFKSNNGYTKQGMAEVFDEAENEGGKWLYDNIDLVGRLEVAGLYDAIGKLCHAEHKSYFKEVTAQAIEKDSTLTAEAVEEFLNEALITGLDLAMYQELGVSINPIEE